MIYSKINKRAILEWVILSFAFFPIIPNKLKGFLVIILLLVSLFNYKKHTINYKWFFINSSLYLLFIISLMYTNNIPFALKKIETALSILIFPLIFFIILPKINLNKDFNFKFMRLFIGSTSIFSLIIISAIILDHSTKYYKNFYSNKFRIIVEKTSLIGQHPTYASIFLGVALLFLAYLFINKSNKLKYNYWLYFTSATIISTLLIMLSSKVVIISLFIIILLYFTKKALFTGFNKKFLIYIGAVLTLILLLFIFNRRMNEMVKFNTYTEVNSNFSNSYRVNIYECAEDIIKKNWLTGVGVGDAQDVLNQCYKNKSNLLLKKTYNTHNQYLDIWIKTGLIGLIIFLGFLGFNFIEAYKTYNYILILIIIFYSINFLTENILVRQSGIILFAFFINFLGSLNKDSCKRNSN